ncbi:MAG: TonB-dependent receptor [Bryobacteraceae bacterium]
MKSPSIYSFGVCFLASSAILFAQIDRASIVGRIQDSSAAPILGASVQIVRQSTNQTFTATTTDSGDYTVVNLPADVYEVRATMAGFKTNVRSGVKLEIGQAMRVDFQMGVGDVTETVSVTAEAPVLKTESPEFGQVVTNNVVIGLPVRSRDFLAFVSMVPGAAPQRGTVGGGNLDQGGYNVSGQRKSDNVVYIDGGMMTQGNGATTFFPNLDALQEVEVKTGLYGAEFGVKPGGQISTVTKSGTNALHGTGFYFHRNNIFNARNFFDPSTIPDFKNHLYGGMISGPVRLPKVMDGRDKLWFLFSASAENRRQFQSLSGQVPTLDERAGRFATTVIDPLTGSPFPNNTIPTSRFNPVAQKLIGFYPEPNTTGRGFNYINPKATNDRDSYQYIGKIDWARTASDRWAGSFVNDSTPVIANSPVDIFSVVSPLKTWIFNIRNTRTIGTSVVNDAGIYLFRRAYSPTFVQRPGFGATLGIPQLTQTYVDLNGVPITSVTGLVNIGDQSLSGVVPIGQWEVRESLSFNKGAHSIKAGYNFRRQFFLEALLGRSSFLFNPRYTGNAFGDFLIGNPSTATLGTEILRSNMHQDGHYMFIQDSWKATSKLTLTLGLRYELRLPWLDKRGFATNFNWVTGQLDPPPQNLTLQPWETGRFVANKPLIEFEKNAFLPRLGAAWRVSERMTVRAGYGAYASEPIAAVPESFGGNARPNATTRQYIANATVPNISLSDPFGLSAGPVIPNAAGSERKWPNAITQQWGLSIQYGIGKRTVVEASYQGSNGVHEPNIVQLNDATPGTTPRQSRRPYPNFQTIAYSLPNGQNNTQALLGRVEHRPGPEGLTVVLSYTWLKAIDTVGGRLGIVGDPSARSRNLPIGLNRGLGEGNVPTRLTATVGYDLPFGAGKSMAMGGAWGKILGGWTVYGLLAYQRGPYITPVMSFDRNDVGSTASFRPDVLRNPNIDGGQRTPLRWFDTAAFANPALFSYGNAGRSIIQAPGIMNLDSALLRSFRVTEGSRLEFRWELFNATNHTNFGIPGTTFGTPQFGVLTSALESRNMQLAIKYYF